EAAEQHEEATGLRLEEAERAPDAEIREGVGDERVALPPEAEPVVGRDAVEDLEREVQQEELVQALGGIHPGRCRCKGSASHSARVRRGFGDLLPQRVDGTVQSASAP